VPFVLSWSMLNAMACGAPIVGSATPPVEEVISDGENGLLVDFHDPDAIADGLDQALDDRELASRLRENGLVTIRERYALDVTFPKLEELYARAMGRTELSVSGRAVPTTPRAGLSR
ncbi:MAG: hypothetical protein CL933_06795, partial [Deltaproteobacteria bacterium]|nr:hypothetical protein [Deltaproteobacteria bacterium]